MICEKCGRECMKDWTKLCYRCDKEAASEPIVIQGLAVPPKREGEFIFRDFPQPGWSGKYYEDKPREVK